MSEPLHLLPMTRAQNQALLLICDVISGSGNTQRKMETWPSMVFLNDLTQSECHDLGRVAHRHSWSLEFLPLVSPAVNVTLAAVE